MRHTVFIVIALLLTPAALADTSPKGSRDQATVPEPPPPPENYNPPTVPGAQNTGQPEPEVTITTKGKEKHEEYRINGRLYMIKVIPAHGKPYYLIDKAGNGQFHRSDFEPRISVPMWVIKSW
ncbi:MAG: DUF2782 domain-containing protein [Sulfuricaulis sp.]